MKRSNPMSFQGTAINGVIVLDREAKLPNGTRVEVVVRKAADQPIEPKPTLLSLLELAGTAKDLPEDMAEQHDHYLHGTPKR